MLGPPWTLRRQKPIWMSSYIISVCSNRTMIHIKTLGRAAFDRNPHRMGRAIPRLHAESSGGTDWSECRLTWTWY